MPALTPAHKKEIETEVARLFSESGFTITKKRASFLATIDLPDRPEDFHVLCIFKYERTENLLRELLQKLDVKNKKLKEDKIIVVLFGVEAYGEDREMASTHNILVWEEANVNEYFTLLKENKEEAVKKLLSQLGIGTYLDETISGYVQTQDN